jgi:hypothetical protein
MSRISRLTKGHDLIGRDQNELPIEALMVQIKLISKLVSDLWRISRNINIKHY